MAFAAPSLLGVALALAVLAPCAQAQDTADLPGQSTAAARGLFELCRADAPDAGRVAEQGEIWGWPRFMGYPQHPEGYQREAGGESRRDFASGDKTAFVEATVQSGEVTAAAPAHVDYFRCNAASDQPIEAALAAYFTAAYGQPALKTDAETVWLSGAAREGGTDSDDAALKALEAKGPGAQALRIELVRRHGIVQAKLTEFVEKGGRN
ncbi:MAG: hypothetical protein ACREEW_19130 [Caulobacteraceae bacterium]